MSRPQERKKTKPVTRPTAGDSPPPLPQPFPPGRVADSPLPKGIEAQAQKLLHEAGSPQLAKQAVDTAARRETIPDFRQDMLAQKLGFTSRENLLAASTPITAADGTVWWATNSQRESRWSLWSEESMETTDSFGSLEEVRRHVYAAK